MDVNVGGLSCSSEDLVAILEVWRRVEVHGLEISLCILHLWGAYVVLIHYLIFGIY